MNPKSLFTRRFVIAGAGGTAVALTLGDIIFPAASIAADKPKKGGKLVYAVLGHNSKHKSLKKAKHPYAGIEIRTKNVTVVDTERSNRKVLFDKQGGVRGIRRPGAAD